MNEEAIKTEVLVIGGGGAGLRAAIGAAESGAETLLISKGPLARCGATPMAGADFTLCGRDLADLGFTGEPHDSSEKVFNDIVTQGFYLNNQKLLEQYIQAAPFRLKELLEWGIQVVGSEERAIFTSGLNIIDALLRRAKECGVKFLDDIMILDLVTSDGRVAGALGLDINRGEFLRFDAKAVVICSGGWHKAFWPNTGMRDLSGEGIALAHRAGAEIGNMEFITFCCNILYSPPVYRGSVAAYILYVLVGGRLSNSDGEFFLEKYDPALTRVGTETEWNKCFLSFTSMKEVRDGKGSPNGGILYDRGDVPWDRFEVSPAQFFKNWKYKAMDLSKLRNMLKDRVPVEVGPAAQYFDGGIVVSHRFETSLRGLYAAGECTLGPFGANRVFSAITEMLVQGRDAGKNAAEYARYAQIPQPNSQAFNQRKEKAESPLPAKEGLRAATIRRDLQEKAHKFLGPIRNEEELIRFVSILNDIKKNKLPHLSTVSKSRIYNKEWIDALELENMVFLLEAAAKSALWREESRGVHFREDFPNTDNDRFLVESRVKWEEGALKVSSAPATITTFSPPGGKIPYLDMMKSMMAAHSDVGGHH
ncbi:FAD-binding protein [Thermodesulfobacteriota bacterium]